MLMSGLFGEDLFDEFFGFPTSRELANLDKRVYGKHAQNLMRTDVHENDTDYEMDMDLPGFKNILCKNRITGMIIFIPQICQVVVSITP